VTYNYYLCRLLERPFICVQTPNTASNDAVILLIGIFVSAKDHD